jgi:hypothetical protein
MSTAIFDGIMFGLLLAVGLGLVWAFFEFYRISLAQKHILERQRLIEAILDRMPLMRQLAGAASWRDLAPAEQKVFRDLLLEVVAQMDEEMPPHLYRFNGGNS